MRRRNRRRTHAWRSCRDHRGVALAPDRESVTTTMSAPRTEATQARIARFEDLDALVRVTAPVSEDAEQRISALLRDPDGRVLVAVEHGEFLGWVFVRT